MLCFTAQMDNDTQHNSKATQDLKAKKYDILH